MRDLSPEFSFLPDAPARPVFPFFSTPPPPFVFFYRQPGDRQFMFFAGEPEIYREGGRPVAVVLEFVPKLCNLRDRSVAASHSRFPAAASSFDDKQEPWLVQPSLRRCVFLSM